MNRSVRVQITTGDGSRYIVNAAAGAGSLGSGADTGGCTPVVAVAKPPPVKSTVKVALDRQVDRLICEVLEQLPLLKDQLAVSCLHIFRRGDISLLFGKFTQLENRLRDWKKELDDLLIEMGKPFASALGQRNSKTETDKIRIPIEIKATSASDLHQTLIPDEEDEFEIKLEEDLENDGNEGDEIEEAEEANHHETRKSDADVNRDQPRNTPPDSNAMVTIQLYKCVQCSAEFYNDKALARHRILKHKKPTATTKSSNQQLKDHDRPKQIKYHNLAPLSDRTCPECSRVFLGLYEMKRHLRDLHYGAQNGTRHRQPVRCDIDDCGYVFPTKIRARAHQLEAHGKISDTMTVPMVHTPRVVQPRPDHYECTEPDCGAKFKHQQGLHEHKRNIHRGHQKVKCRNCQAVLLRREMRTHRRTVHGAHTDTEFICDTCAKSYKGKTSLDEHRRIKHGPSGGDSHLFTCPHCDKKFSQKRNLVVHERIHTGKPYMCDECGLAFTTNASLKEHKACHAKGTARTRTGIRRKRKSRSKQGQRQ